MNEPIISPWLFYLVGNLENFKDFFHSLMTFSGMIIFCYLVGWLITFGEEVKLKNWTFIILVCLNTLFSGIYYSIPNKETAYTMLVASMVTPNNIKAAGEAADKVIDYTGDKADAFATRLSEIITDSAVKVIEEVKK